MRPFRNLIAALVLFSGANPAAAATVTFDLPGTLDRQSVAYACEGSEAPLAVTYFNLPDTQLAVLAVKGTPRAFVNVLAASGAKYASGSIVWWTRGNVATLYDETMPDAQPTRCKVSR
jgi:membrane-bound inhibitor of C-type lysozyme